MGRADIEEVGDVFWMELQDVPLKLEDRLVQSALERVLIA
jgi:hypothetical protein